MDWFLYDRDMRRGKVSLLLIEKGVLWKLSDLPGAKPLTTFGIFLLINFFRNITESSSLKFENPKHLHIHEHKPLIRFASRKFKGFFNNFWFADYTPVT